MVNQLLHDMRESLSRPSLDPADHPDLPAPVRDRLTTAGTVAEARMTQFNDAMAPRVPEWEATLRKIQSAGVGKKTALKHLRRVTAEFSALGAPLSGCQKGCSHCCHIPVGLSQSEAEIIGDAIGRRPRAVRAGIHMRKEYGYEYPCPFLKEARCSIYEHRPLACRTHLNMDADDLLCELIPGTIVPVPLADSTQFMVLYALICGPEPLGDIRDFFAP